jgi:hypothetical protein
LVWKSERGWIEKKDNVIFAEGIIVSESCCYSAYNTTARDAKTSDFKDTKTLHISVCVTGYHCKNSVLTEDESA